MRSLSSFFYFLVYSASEFPLLPFFLSFFFFFNVFIYLAALGLSCSTQDLC